MRQEADRDLPDAGFSLFEVLVALAVVGTVMTAAAVFFVNGVTSSYRQRNSQAAVRAAGDAVETVFGLAATALRSGRDQARTAAHWNARPAAVTAYLAGTTAAYDSSATSSSTPKLPFSEPITVNGVRYTRSVYLGACYRVATDPASSCTATGGSSAVPFTRVVVAVGWTDQGCRSTGCLFVTTTLVGSVVDDAVFALTPQASALTIASPGNRQDTVGTRLSLRLRAVGGVDPVTWSYTNLPTGVTGSQGGVVLGTPTTAGTSSTTFTVTDGANRATSVTVMWQVVAP